MAILFHSQQTIMAILLSSQQTIMAILLNSQQTIMAILLSSQQTILTILFSSQKSDFKFNLLYLRWIIRKFKNIFPFAKVSFAKGKILGAGWRPTGPEWRVFIYFHWGLNASLNIPNSNICETRLYFELTATNRMSGKTLWAEIFAPKVGKVGYF